MLRGFPEETYWFVGLLVLFLALVPPYLWRLGSGMIADADAIVENGVSAQGEVTGTSREYRSNGGTYSHYLHYAFEVDGRRVEDRQILDRGTWSNYQSRIGQAIEVTYAAGDPENSMILDENPSSGGGRAARIASLFMAALGVFGLFKVIGYGLRVRRETLRVRTH